MMPVKLISIDDQGRLKLSRKAALAEMNKTEKAKEPVQKDKKQIDNKK
jgi:predicted RNA-binding protein with RPS1 domain